MIFFGFCSRILGMLGSTGSLPCRQRFLQTIGVNISVNSSVVTEHCNISYYLGSLVNC